MDELDDVGRETLSDLSHCGGVVATHRGSTVPVWIALRGNEKDWYRCSEQRQHKEQGVTWCRVQASYVELAYGQVRVWLAGSGVPTEKLVPLNDVSLSSPV